MFHILSLFKTTSYKIGHMTFVERNTFSRMFMEEEETVGNYFTRLQAQAANCNFRIHCEAAVEAKQATDSHSARIAESAKYHDLTDEFIRDKLIFSINDSQTKQYLLQQTTELSLQQTLDIIRAAEGALKKKKRVVEETSNMSVSLLKAIPSEELSENLPNLTVKPQKRPPEVDDATDHISVKCCTGKCLVMKTEPEIKSEKFDDINFECSWEQQSEQRHPDAEIKVEILDLFEDKKIVTDLVDNAGNDNEIGSEITALENVKKSGDFNVIYNMSPIGKTVSFNCVYCSFNTSSNDCVVSHQLQFGNYNCLDTECNETFKCKSAFKDHLGSIHPNCKPYFCTECDAIYLKQFSFNRHIKTKHTEIFGNKCCECAEKFSSKQQLDHHLQFKHSDPRGFKCSKCFKKFVSRSERSKHYKVHFYQCSDCGERYSTEIKLVHHLRSVHSDPRPWHCSKCDSRFERSMLLTYHIKSMHLELLKHHCRECDKKFYKRYDLVKHMKRIHKSSPK